MKKKLTKLAALVLAGAMTLTASVLPAAASGDTTVEPEILFYRDYEDYTGGDPIDNSSLNYGTYAINGDSTWDGYTQADSAKGSGFYVATSHINDNHTGFPDMTNGTLYIAFDEIPGETLGETSVYFKSGTPNFAFSYKAGTAWTTADRNWSYDKTDHMLGSGQNHRIDLVIDPATGNADRYVNGNFIGTKSIGITTGLTEMLVRFSKTSIIDNLTMVYFPQGVTAKTFTVAEAATVNTDDDTFRVNLQGSVTDSDGKGKETKSSITASYTAVLPASSLTADAFTVEGLTVKSVSAGTKAGEYKIAVEEDIQPGVNYTITAKTGLKDALGATVSEAAKTATAKKTVYPEVMFYRDFEDYMGGDPYNLTASSRDYGTWGIFGSDVYDDCIAVDGADGTAVKMPKHSTSNNNTSRNDGTTAFNSKANGRIYFAFDLDASANGGGSGSVWSQLVLKETGETGDGIYALTYNAKTNKYVGGDSQYNSNASWGDNTSTGVSADYKNRFELIIDIDNGKIYKYINGILGATHDDAEQGKLSDVKFIGFNPKGENVFDNLAVVHYPKGVDTQTFSVASVEADEKTDVFRVFLKSDTIDADGKGTTTKSEIAAPYGITLPTTDASGIIYSLANDTFSVEGMNVTSVTRGTRSGEYIVDVDGDIKTGESYTVLANADLTDILGSTLNDEKGSKTITAAAELAATAATVDGGVQITFNDTIVNPSEYAKGATIKNVYTGETDTVTLTKASATQVNVSGDISAGDEYVLTLPAGIRGKKGNTLHSAEVRFNTGTSNCLKTLSLVDIQGTVYDLEETNPTGLDSIVFEFSDASAATNAAIAVTNKDGAALLEGTDYTKTVSGSKATFALAKILAPDEEYTVSITGLAKTYEIALNTSEAKLERLPVMFLDANGQKLESISSGDTVKVRLDFVNSTDAAKTFLASASMFEGLEMTGFGHKEITMQPISGGGTGKHTEIFTFTATANDVSLNGYMWSIDGTKFAPIQVFESFE